MGFQVWQFSIVSNVFSFVIATFGASALFFFMARNTVAPRYRTALLMSGLVVVIAGYHYFRIYESWHEAYELTQVSADTDTESLSLSGLEEGDAFYEPTGAAFNDAYRYVDWLLTVPLLLLELLSVLALARAKFNSLAWKLVPAAALMIALGYPGEINRGESGSETIYYLFWALSMIPFLFILFVLFTEFSKAKDDQPKEIAGYFDASRYIILITWSFYPIAYLLSKFIPGQGGEVGVQIGYAIADVIAKAGYGLFIYQIAVTKSRLDGYDPTTQTFKGEGATV